MAVVDKKLLEEEACILRFCKVVLGWDYVRLLKESKVNNLIFLSKIPVFDFQIRKN